MHCDFFQNFICFFSTIAGLLTFHCIEQSILNSLLSYKYRFEIEYYEELPVSNQILKQDNCLPGE